MIERQKFLGLAKVVLAGTLLGCANDSTAPVSTGPVFTSIQIQGPTSPMAPLSLLNTARLEVRAVDQHGVPMIVGMGSFSISSNNPGVATVGETQFWTSESNGVPDGSWIAAYVRAVAPGEAVISVSWTIGGVTKTARSTIRVDSTNGWSVKVDPAEVTVRVGSAKKVRAMLLDATGKTRLQHWGSYTVDRDDVVALYEDEGCGNLQPCDGINVLGVAVGNATLTTGFEGFSATISVTVVP